MATLLKSYIKFRPPIKLKLLHDIKFSMTSSIQSFTHSHSNINITYHSSFNFSSNIHSERKQNDQNVNEQDDNEYEEETETDTEQEDDDTIDAKDQENEQEELEEDNFDDEDEFQDENQPTESQKFLIQYRKSQGLQYTASPDSEFMYKPIPRVSGPSPFVNHDYKKESIRKYPSIETLKLPISSVKPLGGEPEIWIHNSNASKRSIYKLSPDMFNQDVRIDLLWRCVHFERTKKKHWTWWIVKHRGEIHGSGKKLRPQKGSGRARMSNMKAPQCLNGGKAHARRPKSVETNLKMNTYKKGIKIALTARYQEGDLYIWEDFVLPRLDKPEYLKNIELYKSEGINKHPELGDTLVPIEELDWNDNTKLYYDVYKTRQMLNKWG
eukprot:770697_1